MNQASPMAEQPMNLVSSNEQPITQKLTIEQEEERKLKMKYPNPQKPGGSAFIQKMLHKGSKKYFDSGDYNMAKSKKQGLLNGLGKGGGGGGPGTPPVMNQQVPNNASTPVCQQTVSENNSLITDQTMAPANDTNSPINNSSGNFTNSSVDSGLVSNSTCELTNSSIVCVEKMCTPNQKVMMNVQFGGGVNSENVSNNANNSSGFLNNSNSTSPQMSASVSSTNLKNTLLASQPCQQGISSSMSSDKIAHTIQLNQQETTSQLEGEDIGSTIPTPECLPQSRKHSIAQSKLATPHLLNL